MKDCNPALCVSWRWRWRWVDGWIAALYIQQNDMKLENHVKCVTTINFYVLYLLFIFTILTNGRKIAGFSGFQLHGQHSVGKSTTVVRENNGLLLFGGLWQVMSNCDEQICVKTTQKSQIKSTRSKHQSLEMTDVIYKHMEKPRLPACITAQDEAW